MLYLLLGELTKRWVERPTETMLLVEYSDPPVKLSILGHPSKVKEDIEQLLGWQFSCPYCGLKIPFDRFCNKCGRRLL